MSYYTGRGDYYSGKGDPGLGSLLGGVLGGISKVARYVPGVGGAISAVAGTAAKVVSGSPRPALPQITPPSIPVPVPGFMGAVQRAIPGGASGYQCGGSNPCSSGYHLDKKHRAKCVRNRKVNYTNPAALSRAAKRMDGFVTVARRALKTTNYKVVAKGYKQNWRKPLKR